jgi:STE24 endopeptidase
LRDRIKPLSRHAWLRDMLFSAPFLGLLFIIGLPVAIYAGLVLPRERGLSAVPFAQWLRDETLRFGVDSVFYVAGITLVLAFVRWRPRQWVAYAVAVYAVLSAAYIFVAPVAIEPLFNRFEPLPSGPGRDAILALARANGVDGADVVVRDASRQGRVPNANVTGMGGSARITLDDNTLAESSAPMFRLVMAHELGHFVLGHASKEWIARCLVMALGFAFAAWVVNALIARFGTRWGVAHVADVAAIPVFWGAFLAAGVVTLPLENGIHRAFEREADLYGLNASGEPHGLAEFMVQVSDAVKFEPSALEETLFHGHPAPASRVRAAMRWRAEHLPPASRPVAP